MDVLIRNADLGEENGVLCVNSLRQAMGTSTEPTLTHDHGSPINDEIRVLVVDDHEMVAEAIKTMLELSPQIRVVGLAKTRDDVIQSFIAEKLDVVLLDINIPETSGFEIAFELRQNGIEAKLLFLTGYPTINNLELALRCQASGLISKNSRADFLIQSVSAAHRGNTIFDSAISSLVELDRQGCPVLKHPSDLAPLTDRQIEILIQLAKGLSTKQIAKHLYISAKTVENHTYRIMKLLNLENRVELARFAYREGLIQP